VSDAPPPEILSLIEKHIEGFNTQNLEIFHSVFAADAIIIDGIAPYRWLNPDGPAKWLADVEKWREGPRRDVRAHGVRDGILERRGFVCVRSYLRDPYGDD
jgi:hypothetical protein